ncbi:MAG TPA: hypothetical protein VNN78_06450 [Burkholderiales bacterium]|nr:hypothetical protein [Burkholderiales bacterium]
MSLHFSRHLLRRVFESSQFGALYLAAAIYLVISAVTRLILSVLAIRQGELGASALLAVIPIGTLYDIVTCLYLFAPFALYLSMPLNIVILLEQTKTKRDEEQVKNAASIYQPAYTFYLDKLYRWH